MLLAALACEQEEELLDREEDDASRNVRRQPFPTKHTPNL